MASKPSPSTNTFTGEGQDPMPQQPNTVHGNSDVTTVLTPNPALSHAVPKYVTDVVKLMSAPAESRRMFLTEVTRTCLKAAKKDKEDSHQMISLQLDNHQLIQIQLVQDQHIAHLYLVTMQLNQLQHFSTHQVLR